MNEKEFRSCKYCSSSALLILTNFMMMDFGGDTNFISLFSLELGHELTLQALKESTQWFFWYALYVECVSLISLRVRACGTSVSSVVRSSASCLLPATWWWGQFAVMLSLLSLVVEFGANSCLCGGSQRHQRAVFSCLFWDDRPDSSSSHGPSVVMSSRTSQKVVGWGCWALDAVT